MVKKKQKNLSKSLAIEKKKYYNVSIHEFILLNSKNYNKFKFFMEVIK